MEHRYELSPQLRRRFQTGRACLDFTHTGGDGEYAKWELLHEPADAARFLGVILASEAPRVRRSDMDVVVDVRRAITVLARTRVADMPAPAAALEQLNEAASNPPLVPVLSHDGSRHLVPGGARQAISTIARDAIDLFSSPLADRIRVCAAHDCGLLFVDTSRPGRRRWCSMDWCGDREKKRIAGRPDRRGTLS